jgi:hypothetical protein
VAAASAVIRRCPREPDQRFRLSGVPIPSGRPPSFVGVSLVETLREDSEKACANAFALVRTSISGADDGIRTRDPHLGKVPRAAFRTCGDETICRLSRALSVSCNPVIPRCFPVADGTPTGPLLPRRLTTSRSRAGITHPVRPRHAKGLSCLRQAVRWSRASRRWALRSRTAQLPHRRRHRVPRRVSTAGPRRRARLPCR